MPRKHSHLLRRKKVPEVRIALNSLVSGELSWMV